MDPIARIAVEKAAFRFDKLYDYAVPEGTALSPGMRVMIPFGRGRERVGLVVETAARPEREGPLKAVCSVLDADPILSEEGLFLLRWLKENTFCTWFEALSVLIPLGYGMRGSTEYSLFPGAEAPGDLSPEEARLLSALSARRKPVDDFALGESLGVDPRTLPTARLESLGLIRCEQTVKRRVEDKMLRMVRLTGEEPASRLTERQQAVYDLLSEVGCGSVREICYFAGVTRGVVDKLTASGAAEYYEEEILRDPYSEADREGGEPETPLSPEQQAAADLLWQGFAEGGRTGLLYGVTGSGKTLVYLSLIRRVVAAGRRAIVLVPEISLTPQTIRRFHQSFGKRVAVLHSGLSLSQRLDEYKRVRRGMVDIVVGTRSAVFAPVDHLGLIVVDEEQEHTYLSEKSPRYDAREVARLRAKYHHGLAVLASATPSVESRYRAQKGEYLFAQLPARYGEAILPEVTILDLREKPMAAEALSEELCEELLYNLQRHEQSILLVNRRGYSATAQCMSCHQPIQCPNCSISLKYHAANGRLMCHYCGYSTEPPRVCPVCGSKMMRYSGVGTQKVEEALRVRFPEARILRMDQDTTMRRDSHQNLLAAFGAGDYDIMVGTQMVAKGLDFPRVTLVGVLTPDQSLFGDDFRSYERTFSLITQVVGRCGRRDLPGRAYLQTYEPEHPVITAAARQDYESFYHGEIQTRRYLLYPPFCRLYCIGFWGESEEQVRTAGEKTLALLLSRLREDYPELPVRVLGLSPAGILKVAGRYRYKILVKGKNSSRMRELLASLLTDPATSLPGVTLTVDPSYDSSL